MKKSNVIYIISLIALITFSLILAIYTKKSFINDIEFENLKLNSSRLNFIIAPSPDKNYVSGTLKTLEQLEDSSTLISKIKVTNNREYKCKTLLTKCKIEKVFKHSNNIEDEYIYIYEPASFNFYYNSFKAVNGYNYMQTNDEYIVFLKELDMPNNYKKKYDSPVYTFVDSACSKFNLQNGPSVLFIHPDDFKNGLPYNNVINYEYVFNSKDLYDIYLDIYHNLLNKHSLVS